MHIKLYFHPTTDQIVIPASAKTEAGFYVDQGPVEIVNLQDSNAVLEAAQKIWAYGHPLVPTPDRDSHSRYPTFELRGIRTWSDVERQCSLWDITEKSDRRFQLERWISPPRQRGFIPDANTSEILPEGSVLSDAVSRLITQLRELPPK